MFIKKAEFEITVAESSKILKTAKNEFAFVGRSNAGKSSLINALTNNKNLAKTSSTPGLTKHINYFRMNNGEFYLVDLPGYGYHKAGKKDEERWTSLLEDYFRDSPNLKLVFVLMDIRVGANDLDRQMLKYLIYYNIPFMIVLTKADKISKAQRKNCAFKIATDLGLTINETIVTSSDQKFGLDEILNTFDRFITKD